MMTNSSNSDLNSENYTRPVKNIVFFNPKNRSILQIDEQFQIYLTKRVSWWHALMIRFFFGWKVTSTPE